MRKIDDGEKKEKRKREKENNVVYSGQECHSQSTARTPTNWNAASSCQQGGCYSSDSYKLFNNELLDIANASRQGVVVGMYLLISCVGQADDMALLPIYMATSMSSIWFLTTAKDTILNQSPYLPIQLAAVASSYTATSVDLTDRHVTGSC